MKKKINNDKILDKIKLDIGDNAVSATEMTGLIPAETYDDYSKYSYKQINNYEQRPISHKKKHNNP